MTHIVDDALNSIGPDLDALDACLKAAARIDGVPAEVLSFHRSFAKALRGDFEGSVRELGLAVEDVASAPGAAQIRCAVALVLKDRLAEAYPILQRNEGELSEPDGLLMLARCALGAGHESTARRVLAKLSASAGSVATTAGIALDLAEVVRHAGAERMLAKVMAGRAATRLDRLVTVGDAAGATTDTDWEGEHRPGSRVLDRMATALLN